MPHTTLRLADYNTDKIPNGYLAVYEPFLARFVNQPIRLLELGVKDGGSLLLWRTISRAARSRE
jgi:hypothetical protein